MIIVGDLLTAKEKYIVHQTNCVSTHAGGLAYFLFKKYPYADIYHDRTEEDSDINSLRDNPGDISIKGNGLDQRYIINLMGQLYPGVHNKSNDSEMRRLEYFSTGLIKISKIHNLESIAFPYKIGCGLGGGDWNHYHALVEAFAKLVYDNQGAKVTIYQREGDL